MANYFRITAYHSAKNVCAVFDSNGRFEKLWQFSAYLVNKGFKITAVGSEEKFRDGDLRKVPECQTLILRACAKGEPQISGNRITIHGKYYEVIS